jgi:hypothetical protein
MATIGWSDEAASEALVVAIVERLDTGRAASTAKTGPK